MLNDITFPCYAGRGTNGAFHVSLIVFSPGQVTCQDCPATKWWMRYSSQESLPPEATLFRATQL